MKEIIEQTLNVLIGLPLWDVKRAADLNSFQFGAYHLVPTHRGGRAEVGDYTLHIQCAWRITNTKKIIVASRDRYYPANDAEEIPENFKWDVQGANRCDKRIADFFEQQSDRPLIVQSIEADFVGSFKLNIIGGFTLDVFPDNSFDEDDSEHWRFFKPGNNTKHFVVTGYGIEE